MMPPRDYDPRKGDGIQGTLDWAAKHAPQAVALAASALALLSVVVYALSFGLPIGSIVAMTAVVVVTGTLGLVIPAWIRGKAPKHFATVATLLAFVIAISTAGTLLLALLFPDRFSIGPRLWSMVVDPAELFRPKGDAVRMSSLEAEPLRRYGDTAEEGIQRLEALSKRGTLTLTGDISATDRTTIVVHTLRLENTRLHLASHDLKIEVLDLVISGPSRIVAHPNKSPNADKDGANGGNVQIIASQDRGPN